MGAFPFFRLPAELRNSVYADVGGVDAKVNITFDREQLPRCPLPTVQAEFSCHPAPNLLLVSKQFKHEYETELQRHNILRLERPRGSSLPTLPLEGDRMAYRRLRSISKLEIKLWDPLCYNCDPDEYYVGIRDSILPHMPHLKTITNDFMWTIHDVVPKQRVQLAFETQTLALPFEGKSATLTNRVHLTAQLFRINTSRGPTTVERERYPFVVGRAHWNDMWHYLDESSVQNWVVYRVVPSIKSEETEGEYDLVVVDKLFSEFRVSMDMVGQLMRELLELDRYVSWFWERRRR